LKTAYRYTVALLLALTLGLGVAPQPPNSVEIPLRSSHDFGLMLVEVRVNGKPAVFILDTGSNHTIVSSKLVDVATPSLRDAVTSKKSSGYSGNGIFTRASLAVGPVLWRDHRILAMDTHEISKSLGESVDGLLGLDFLNEFDTVVVDFRQHKLILTRSAR
jgi:predicted aspartyl protease